MSEPIVVSSGGRILRLDGFRWWAAFVVFMSHALPMKYQLGIQWGAYAVAFFFVLSGFVITRSMLQGWEGDRGLRNMGLWWWTFFRKRIFRILPPFLLVMLFIQCFIPIALMPNAWEYWFFLGNMSMYWHGVVNPASAHLWSVAVEEQFYLIWPLLFMVGKWRFQFNQSLHLFLVFLVFGGLLIRLFGHGVLFPNFYREQLMPMVFEALMIGALLTSFRPIRKGVLKVLLPLGFFVFMLGVVPTFWGSVHSNHLVLNELRYQAVIFISACWIIRSREEVVRIFDVLLLSEWVQYAGRFSYGFYLFHVPILYVIRASAPMHWIPTALLTLLLTICVSIGSYEFVERPLMRWNRNRMVISP